MFRALCKPHSLPHCQRNSAYAVRLAQAMPNEDDTTLQLNCPHCGAEIERTLGYLRAHRVLWCQSCGQSARYDDAAVRRAEEAVRELRRKLH